MPLVLFVAAAAAVCAWRDGCRPFDRRDALLLLPVAVLLAALTFWLVPPAQRMQFDETSLCGTAQNMHVHRTARMTMAAVPRSAGELTVLDWNLDKRPPLMPFLVSLLHDLSGYRVANAFVLNGLLLAALLTVLGAAVRRAFGSIAALAAMLLALAAPLVPHVATSAGFELLATFLLLVCIVAARAVVVDPRPQRVAWLLAAGLVFAQARYESALVFAVLLAAVGWRVRGALVARGTWWVWGSGALLCVPLALQLWHGRDAGFYLEAGGASLLSLSNLLTHGKSLAVAFAELGGPLPGAALLVGLSAAALRWRRAGAALLVVAPVLAATAIALAWFYGDVREPTAVRLFLPLALLAAISPVLIAAFGRPALTRWLLVAAAIVCALQLPRAARTLPKPLAVRVLEVVDAALARVALDPATTVCVSSVAQYLNVHGMPAMPANVLPARGAGAATQILFVETPLDAQLAPWFGDVRPLRVRAGAELVVAIDGELPVSVYRLRR